MTDVEVDREQMILNGLEHLAKVRARREALDKIRDEKREAILKPIKQKIEKMMGPYEKQITKLMQEYEDKVKDVAEKEAKIERRVKDLVVQHKESVKADILHAVYTPPKVTWNVEQLEALRAVYPPINVARKEAENGTCSVRKSAK